MGYLRKSLEKNEENTISKTQLTEMVSQLLLTQSEGFKLMVLSYREDDSNTTLKQSS